LPLDPDALSRVAPAFALRAFWRQWWNDAVVPVHLLPAIDPPLNLRPERVPVGKMPPVPVPVARHRPAESVHLEADLTL
jgi:hypothetical protein